MSVILWYLQESHDKNLINPITAGFIKELLNTRGQPKLSLLTRLLFAGRISLKREN